MRDSVEMADDRNVLMGERETERRKYHCIPRRHFIFSILCGHVINRSQYVHHTAYSAYVACSQYTSYINVIVRLLNRPFYNLDSSTGIHLCVSYILHYVTSLSSS